MDAHHCPTCGQTLPPIDKPIVDLATNSLLIDGASIKLRGREAELLFVLIKAMPRLCSRAMIYDSIYPWGDDVGEKNIDVFVCRLRRKLVPTSLRIENVFGRGFKLVRSELEARLAS